jgi:hypothetical protein
MTAATAYKWAPTVTGAVSSLYYVQVDGEIVVVASGNAMALRELWLKMQGIPDDEIAVMCNPREYPGCVADELSNLHAAQALRQNDLTTEELAAFAQKHSPPADW